MGPRRRVIAAMLAAVLPAMAATEARADSSRHDVIVTLRQTAPAGVAHRERDLRRAAQVTQRPVLRLLQRRRAQGRARVVRRFWVFNGLEVRADRRVIRELSALPGVLSVRPNTVLQAPPRSRRARAASTSATGGGAAIGASALWDRGITGRGVVIASLDSGVDVSHPALAASYKGGRHAWFDPSGEHPSTPYDASGHGTWTMGVMLGSGAGGTPTGAAPGARWIAAKVFDDSGRSTTARIHAAFQWALDPDGNPRTRDAPQVVNSSWDIAGDGCDLEFEPDLRELRAAGVLPVFAGGNDGRDASPANNPSAFSVGAVDGSGALAPGSGQGPSACGSAIYPRIVAPGVDVATTDLFGLSTTQTGTSMAAPQVSGALALLLSRFRHLSAQRQQAALESGAADLGRSGPDSTFGYGRLDVAKASAWLSGARDFTLRPSRWSSRARWGDAAIVHVQLAGLHGFACDVRLSATGLPRGASATFSRAVVRHARGTSRLVLRPRAGVALGTYPLTIRASGGGLTRSITIAMIVRAGGRQ